MTSRIFTLQEILQKVDVAERQGLDVGYNGTLSSIFNMTLKDKKTNLH